jgi:hypothetical protein
VPHVGPVDELQAAGQSTVPDFKDGAAWGDPSMDAEWVYDFNIVLRAVSQLYGDVVLDLHTVSIQLLRYISEKRNVLGSGRGAHVSSSIQVHSDAMHYCAGGLFRASNLLLYHLLKYVLVLPTH